MSIARALLLRASRSKWLAEQFRRRRFAKRAVKRFMPGEDAGAALDAAAEFAKIGIGSLCWIDMEESWYVDDTLALYRDIRAAGQQIGLAMQAYLYRTPKDVESLLPLKPIIRLVKGAYNESAEVAYPKKADTDRAYLEIGEQLINGGARAVFGTHDMAIIDEIRRRHGNSGYEVHMLYGIKAGEQ